MKSFLFAQVFSCIALAASAAGAQQKMGTMDSILENPEFRGEAVKLMDNGILNINRNLAINNCPLMVYSRKTQFETTYGGSCVLNNGMKLVLCADSGIGEFALSERSSAVEASIAKFMDQNCPGR